MFLAFESIALMLASVEPVMPAISLFDMFSTWLMWSIALYAGGSFDVATVIH